MWIQTVTWVMTPGKKYKPKWNNKNESYTDQINELGKEIKIKKIPTLI